MDISGSSIYIVDILRIDDLRIDDQSSMLRSSIYTVTLSSSGFEENKIFSTFGE